MSRRKSVLASGSAIIVEPVAGARNETPGTADDSGDGNPAADSAGIGAPIDPASVAASNGDFTERKRRGRPPGSGNKTKSVPAGISGIEKTLFGIHQMLGAIIAPELALGEDDAHQMADAISAVNRHYQIRMFDAKTQDWLNLIMVAGAMYGSRVVAIRERVKVQRMARPAMPRAQTANAAPGNPASAVSPMNNTPPAQQDQTTVAQTRVANTGIVPGIGEIQFPPDHPLSPLQQRRH